MLPAGLIAERRLIQRLLRSNAVAPAEAQPLADLRGAESGRLARLIGIGVVRESPPGRYYLSAPALLRALRDARVPHAIATSGRRPEINGSLASLGVGAETVVVERGDVLRAKPAPDLFLNCQQRLGIPVDECYVVGDAVWDLLGARRAKMLSVGLLSGGYGWDELISAGAFRVYRDPADLHRSLDELGIV